MNRNEKRVAAAYLRVRGHGARDGLKCQWAACEKRASRLGLKLATVYSDAADVNPAERRDEFKALLEAAERGEFDVLLVEGLDRLSRDPTELSRICRTLERCGVEIWPAHGGKLEPRAFPSAFMARLYGDAMRQRIRLGQESRARRGLGMGGRCYGYAAVPGKPGERMIVPGQADVVRKAFAMRLQGVTPARIAKALNRMPGADRLWSEASVRNLLRNQLYVGVSVYGRTRILRDPATGEVRRESRPRTEWTVASAEHLRIVPREIWDAVQATLKAG